MIEKYFSSGDKIELHPVRPMTGDEASRKKVYLSKINEILGEDKLELLMPIEQSKIVLIPRNAVYDMVVFTSHGLFQCSVKITDRYKNGNIYLQVVELMSGIQRYQRREFYRYECSLPILCRHLEETEIEEREWDRGAPGETCLAIDIGGGGARFISMDEYHKDEVMLVVLKLEFKGGAREIQTMAKVLSTKVVDPALGKSEVRVQFEGISSSDREKIIQYIFEDERKRRKNMNGN